MNESNFIFNWLEDLKFEINELSFGRNDIRTDFYGLVYDIAYTYYKGFLMLNISDFICDGKFVFKDYLYR